MALHKQKHHHNEQHIPVLLEDVLTVLAPSKGESYLDLTAGYGGHATRILERTDAPENMTLVDRDATAISALQTFTDVGATVIHSDYASAVDNVSSAVQTFDMILMDLGVSSVHLDNYERGFSIVHDGPLDMRMDQRHEITAATIVNTWAASDLEDAIRRYGEEPHARRIARAIVDHRPIQTTHELATIIRSASPYKHSRHHPATRTFQALRIVVNGELDQLAHALEILPHILNPGGRLAVISFHSLEDRLVKQAFRRVADPHDYESDMRVITSRPVLGSHHDVHNPRARSAKLRAVVKINT